MGYEQVPTHLAEIREKIAVAVQNANRKPEEVQLVAVSKFHPLEAVQVALTAGQQDFGENYVQEITEKAPQLPDARWHLIGHLQTNKVKQVLPFVHLIHTLDSAKLLAEIEKQALKLNQKVLCLLQLQIATEDTKTGANEAEAEAILTAAADCQAVTIVGLMGMASFTEDSKQIRKEFQQLARKREDFQRLQLPNVSMQHLSMGMTSDFQIAIEEGSTLLRIGTAIFGSR